MIPAVRIFAALAVFVLCWLPVFVVLYFADLLDWWVG